MKSIAQNTLNDGQGGAESAELRSRDKAHVGRQLSSTLLPTLVAVLLMGLLFFIARVVSIFSGQEVENQTVANGVDTLTGDGENVSDQPKRLRPCVALSILTVFV
jgi:hypothetical protein